MRSFARSILSGLSRGESPRNVNIRFSPEALFAERSAAMNIHAGNDADNCGARADPKETRRDYASRYARAFLGRPPGRMRA